jgi:hypothetical protein
MGIHGRCVKVLIYFPINSVISLFHPQSHIQHIMERNCGGHIAIRCGPSTRYRVRVTVSMQAVLSRQIVYAKVTNTFCYKVWKVTNTFCYNVWKVTNTFCYNVWKATNTFCYKVWKYKATRKKNVKLKTALSGFNKILIHFNECTL